MGLKKGNKIVQVELALFHYLAQMSPLSKNTSHFALMSSLHAAVFIYLTAQPEWAKLLLTHIYLHILRLESASRSTHRNLIVKCIFLLKREKASTVEVKQDLVSSVQYKDLIGCQ